MAAILSFVNVSQQDAFLWGTAEDGELAFVARIAPGQMVRQHSLTGTQWSVVAGETYPIVAADTSRAYLISQRGLFEVTATRAIAPEGGSVTNDSGYRTEGGSPAPMSNADYRTEGGSPAPMSNADYRTEGGSPAPMSNADYRTEGGSPAPNSNLDL